MGHEIFFYYVRTQCTTFCAQTQLLAIACTRSRYFIGAIKVSTGLVLFIGAVKSEHRTSTFHWGNKK